MTPNLPLTPPPMSKMPGGGLRPLSSFPLGHSRIPSVSQTQPTTSVSHLMQSGANKPITSISHSAANEADHATSIHAAMNNAQPTTSIAHDAKYSISDTQSADETQDQLRYDYAQRHAIREAKQEADAAKHSDAYTFEISGTGHQFHDKGASGFARHMKAQVRHHLSDFREMKEKGIVSDLHDVTEKRMKSKTTGSDITRRDRIRMRKEMKEKINENPYVHNKRAMYLKSKKIINQLRIAKPGDKN